MPVEQPQPDAAQPAPAADQAAVKQLDEKKSKLEQEKKEFEHRVHELDNREARLKQDAVKLEADQSAVKNDQAMIAEEKKALDARSAATAKKEHVEEEKDREVMAEREKLAERERGLAAKDHELQNEFSRLDDEKRAVYLQQQDLLQRQHKITEGETDLAKHVAAESQALEQKSLAQKGDFTKKQSSLEKEEHALVTQRTTLQHKSAQLDKLEKTLDEERSKEKKTYADLRKKLDKELADAQHDRSSFAKKEEEEIAHEKMVVEKKSAQQLVAEELRVQNLAKNDVEAARASFLQKETAMRHTVLSLERAEADMEKRTAALVDEKMHLNDELRVARDDLEKGHRQYESAQASIHAGEERDRAHAQTENGLKSAVAKDETQLKELSQKVKASEGGLKEAQVKSKQLEEKIQQAKDDAVKAEAKLRKELDDGFKKQLHDLEKHYADDEQELLNKQKREFTKDSDKEIAALAEAKAKAAKEE